MNNPTKVRVTEAGMVFEAAPPGGFSRDGPKPLAGSKPKDILLRQPGECAAIVASRGLIHFACCEPVDHDRTDWCYCEAHNPRIPLNISPKEFVRGLRKHLA